MVIIYGYYIWILNKVGHISNVSEQPISLISVDISILPERGGTIFHQNIDNFDLSEENRNSNRLESLKSCPDSTGSENATHCLQTIGTETTIMMLHNKSINCNYFSTPAINCKHPVFHVREVLIPQINDVKWPLSQKDI